MQMGLKTTALASDGFRGCVTALYGAEAGDMVRILVEHFLLARRRRAPIGRLSRVELVIPQVKTCSDFRDLVSVAHNRVRRPPCC